MTKTEELDQAIRAYEFDGSPRQRLSQIRDELLSGFQTAHRCRDYEIERDRIRLLFLLDTGLDWADEAARGIREIYRLRLRAMADQRRAA